MRAMQEFFHMGGYAFYVWSAYALVFVVLLGNFVAPLVHGRRLLARQRRDAEREDD